MKHTAAIAMNFINEHEIRTMDWPALSRNLNAIEHLWAMGYIGQMIRRRPNPPQALQQLTEALV